MEFVEAVLLTVIAASTPLLLAVFVELVAERAGALIRARFRLICAPKVVHGVR